MKSNNCTSFVCEDCNTFCTYKKISVSEPISETLKRTVTTRYDDCGFNANTSSSVDGPLYTSGADLVGKTWNIKNADFGTFLRTEDNGLVNVRDGAYVWERFTIEDNGDGTYSIKDYFNHYINGVDGGPKTAVNKLGSEKWYFESNTDGSFCFRNSYEASKVYMRATLEKTTTMEAHC